MRFQIHALPAEEFSGLFALSDRALAGCNARRMVVQAKPGTPCRVSMADAEIGDTVILLNYQHQPAPSPYQAAHAIFVREGVAQAKLAVGYVPEVIRSRLISVRLFGADGMMIDADVVQGERVSEAIARDFADPTVCYAHLHFAKPGCFAALVTRAT